MSAVLLDTHTWAWSLTADRQLSTRATAAIEAAQSVMVSPISFFEIAQKVRLGKWPQMERFVGELPGLLTEQGGGIAALAPEVCIAAGVMPWVHRDPFDRLLVATALHFNLPIVSADSIFDGIIARIW